MSTKTICDGCGEEIKPWNSKNPRESDGLKRSLEIGTGHISETWDLCDPCQDRVATVIAETLPHKPPETWIYAIRPKRVPS